MFRVYLWSSSRCTSYMLLCVLKITRFWSRLRIIDCAILLQTLWAPLLFLKLNYEGCHHWATCLDTTMLLRYTQQPRPCLNKSQSGDYVPLALNVSTKMWKLAWSCEVALQQNNCRLWSWTVWWLRAGWSDGFLFSLEGIQGFPRISNQTTGPFSNLLRPFFCA